MPEDVGNILKESIDSVLQNATYNHKKVGQWTNAIVENSIKRLTAQNKPFKYIGVYGLGCFLCLLCSSVNPKAMNAETSNTFPWSRFGSSDLRDHAADWCRPAHVLIVLLGQLNRR